MFVLTEDDVKVLLRLKTRDAQLDRLLRRLQAPAPGCLHDSGGLPDPNPADVPRFEVPQERATDVLRDFLRTQRAVKERTSQQMNDLGFSQGVKYDGGKLRFDLIPVWPLEELALVFTVGAQKYADRNWEKGLKWSRVYSALQRHLTAFWGGEEVDEETELFHVAQAAWGCFVLLEFMQTHRELDDRP